MKTKTEVDAELERLERLIPELVRDCRPDCVLEAFAAEAETLEHSKPAELASYVDGRIDCMLASAGLIPGDNEGEDCGPK
jgi:hypothetical protein